MVPVGSTPYRVATGGALSARAPAASLLLQRSIPRSAYDFIRSRLINPYTDVLDENAVVFVHIPKTAGKALFGSLFAAPSPGHITARRYRSFDPDRFQRYFKFAVGRNPWDRTVTGDVGRGASLTTVTFTGGADLPAVASSSAA